MEKNVLSRIYDRRFRNIKQSKSAKARDNAWRAIYNCELKKYVKPEMTVVDLGSGPGYFINQVEARNRFAVDLDVNNKKFISDGVVFIETVSQELTFAATGSVDLVFTSNLFEHLTDVEMLFQTLYEIRRILNQENESRLLILMPNIRYAKWDFYNFIDHRLPLNEKSLTEALEICGFQSTLVHKRFFPYSAENVNITIPTTLIKIYLKIPPKFRPFAKQMFIVAKVTANN